MFASLVAILVAVGHVGGSPEANQYFDTLLNSATLRDQILTQGLDPVALTVHVKSFEDKVANTSEPVRGWVEYRNGTLSGLSSMRRYSECQGPYYRSGARSVNCTIAFDKLSFLYDGTLKYGKAPTVSVRARSDVNTSLVFLEMSQTGMSQPHLSEFDLKRPGSQRVEHTTRGQVFKSVKTLEDAFKRYNMNEILIYMFRIVRVLNSEASKIPLPN